ncbi:MAG: helix-turn-helix domain-containing protein [Oscillospiraceae bacterium]|nr:helix-turn-helix domain-containing protein [Oscillospiraceae bacterium]
MQKLRPDMDIGKTLYAMRKKRKMTQEAVVTAMQLLGCTISRMTYSKMERNRYNIRISELIALKHIFDVAYEDFFADLERGFLEG